MHSLNKTRSIIINGHKTSLSLELEFWNQVKKIAAKRKVTISKLIADIDRDRTHINLSSAVRIFVLRQSLIGE